MSGVSRIPNYTVTVKRKTDCRIHEGAAEETTVCGHKAEHVLRWGGNGGFQRASQQMRPEVRIVTEPTARGKITIAENRLFVKSPAGDNARIQGTVSDAEYRRSAREPRSFAPQSCAGLETHREGK